MNTFEGGVSNVSIIALFFFFFGGGVFSFEQFTTIFTRLKISNFPRDKREVVCGVN